MVFALAPAQAIEGPLNYTKTEHHKIFRAGIHSVTDAGDPFECEADGLFQFLRDVRDRANEMGWMEGILNVRMNDDDEHPVHENLLDNYGRISLEQVKTSEGLYIGEEDRKAQDTYMLYRCLMASLSSYAKKRITIWSDQS